MPIGIENLLRPGLNENIVNIAKKIYAVSKRFRIGSRARSGKIEDKRDCRIMAMIGPIIR